jgi:hypothetical protein
MEHIFKFLANNAVVFVCALAFLVGYLIGLNWDWLIAASVH